MDTICIRKLVRQYCLDFSFEEALPMEFFDRIEVRRFPGNTKPLVNLTRHLFLPAIILLLVNANATAQNTDTLGKKPYLTLEQCVDYALSHQPRLQSTLINQSITRETNAINLAAWKPQVNVTGNAIHYIQQSGNSVVTGTTGTTGTTVNTGNTGNTNGSGNTTGTGNTGSTGNTGTTGTTGTGSSSSVSTGVSSRTGASYTNTFVPQLTASQAVYSPTLAYIAKSAPLYVKQSKQVTDSSRINVVTSVTKTFYNLLLTLEQINVLKEDTARLGKNVRDTYHQYKGGIVDETDWDQAVISLNNSTAQLKQADENVNPQYAALKQVMGYPTDHDFNVSFDTLQMIKHIGIDTTEQLNFEKRIEYQMLQTDKSLQHQLIHYYQSAWLPTVSAFFSYNYQFENSNLSSLLSKGNPNSLVGLSFSIPIFTGFARVHGVQRAKLQDQLIDRNFDDLRLQIYTEYKSALANYKGNLFNLGQLQKNVNLAKRVYFVVSLQYRQGIVPYLNVITAESNLITSEINYLNALFQVLSNKVDLQKAMGDITY